MPKTLANTEKAIGYYLLPRALVVKIKTLAVQQGTSPNKVVERLLTDALSPPKPTIEIDRPDPVAD